MNDLVSLVLERRPEKASLSGGQKRMSLAN